MQAFIICHGYATASSIADVCNKMLHKYLFNAIDMPYDVPVSEIVSQVKKILYFNENRDVLILVDLGSLENITELLDDLPNVNLGSSTMFPQHGTFGGQPYSGRDAAGRGSGKCQKCFADPL